MIIFGWGFQTIKNFGPTFKHYCDHSNNEEYYVLTRTITWLTLFFIPIFPYKMQYVLSCPVCQYGIKLNKSQIDELKPLAKTNQLLIDEKITEEEYQNQLNLLNKGGGWNQETQSESVAIDSSTLPLTDRTSTSFCTNCGKELLIGVKFCGNCGAASTTAT